MTILNVFLTVLSDILDTLFEFLMEIQIYMWFLHNVLLLNFFLFTEQRYFERGRLTSEFRVHLKRKRLPVVDLRTTFQLVLLEVDDDRPERWMCGLN